MCSQQPLFVYVASFGESHSILDHGGRNVQQFCAPLQGVAHELLPDAQLNRVELRELVDNGNLPTLTACAAILAWGGMHLQNRNRLFENPDAWLAVAEGIRNGELTRFAAYQAFSELQAEGRLPGMGPAYFTKLIHFLMPLNNDGQPVGMIMDQWAGCSINVLLGENLVRMDTHIIWDGDEVRADYTVSNANNAKIYEAFSTAVHQLAGLVGKTVEEVDRAFLSSGGGNPGSWRRHVIANRRPDG